MTKYYTPDQVAEMFAVKRATVWDWMRKGKLKHVKLSGKFYRISEEQLNEFVNKSE